MPFDVRPAARAFGVALAIGMALLASAGRADDDKAGALESADSARRRLAAPPPSSGQVPQLVKDYLERVSAARRLGDPDRELAEIEAGLSAVGATTRGVHPLLDRLAEFHNDRGDFVSGLRAREQALAVAPSPGQQLKELGLIVSLHASLRDRENATRALAQAEATLQRLRATPGWGRFGEWWQAIHSHAVGHYHAHFGKRRDAEAAFRTCIGAIRAHLGAKPDAAESAYFFLVHCSAALLDQLLVDGKLEEAVVLSAEVRELSASYGESQMRGAFASRLAVPLVRVDVERGRFDRALATIEEASARHLEAGAGEGSIHLARLRALHAEVEMLQGRWQKADSIFEARRRALASNADQARRVGVFSPEWGYALLRMGLTERSLDMLQRIVGTRTERYGQDAHPVWEARAFLGVALAASGQRDAALRELTAAVPRIIEIDRAERASTESGVLRSSRLKWILDGYLALLAQYSVHGERPPGLDPLDEAFRIADLVRGSTVQRALANAASRAVIADRALADMSRQYHDRQREIGQLSDGLQTLLSRGRVATMDPVVERIRQDLRTLQREQANVYAQIEKRYPDYASLLEPKPPGIADVQKLLHPGEVLVSILMSQGSTYVWAIPHKGDAAFVRSPVDTSELMRRVGRVRNTVNVPGISDVQQIPAFAFDAAHALYRQLLGSVETTLQDANAMIIVPHAELSELPFAALITAPFSSAERAPRFEGYADAPWLVKRYALSQLPSTTALATLRRTPPNARHERAFVAFADPVFSVEPPAQATTTARGIAIRRAPLARAGRLSESQPMSLQLQNLTPLPETADEVREIGRTLGADEKLDLYLRERATEDRVKTTDLTGYRVVMFATHGLVPGDLPGLSQPALALSNPTVAGGQEDGLLLMEEILGLNLQADWVVLSACNTASPTGTEEAVSGLGRAFIFAGSRALLVTQWPIESHSARLLTTTVFRNHMAAPGKHRAAALQEASLAVMRQRSAPPEVSFAHPMFWAPFVLIGDGH